MTIATCFNVSLANQTESVHSVNSHVSNHKSNFVASVSLFDEDRVHTKAKQVSSIASHDIETTTYNDIFLDKSQQSRSFGQRGHENSIIPAKNKIPQDFVREPIARSVNNTNSSSQSFENDFQLFDTIKPTQYYRTSHSFSIFQSPTELQNPSSASKISTQSGIEVKPSNLKPFSSDIPNKLLLAQETLITSSNQNQHSAFFKDIEIEDKRTMAHLKTTKPTLKKQFSSTEGISILSPDGLELNTLDPSFADTVDEIGHVEIREVQHRNNFASSYKRRMMSRAEYITYFDWVSDKEIEALHEKILKEYNSNPKGQRDSQELQVAWSNMAMDNIRPEQKFVADSNLSISNDPRQERNLSIVLGVTTSHSATVSDEAMPLDIVPAMSSDLPLSSIAPQKSDFEQTLHHNNSNLAVYNSSLNNASINSDGKNNLKFANTAYSSDTGELSLQALASSTENPFVEQSNIENNLTAQKSDFDPNAYLDQLLPSENIEAVATDSSPAATFKNTVPTVIEDTSAQNEQLPFKIYSYFDGNRAVFDIEIKGNSYVYRDSLKIDTQDNISFELPELPNGVMHEDIQGEAAVYFEHVNVSVPITNCNAGDVLTFSYQGCDEQGICYPVQSYSITMPNAILVKVETNDFMHVINNSINFLQNSEENSIAEVLQDNLLLGLLICFILGIGLDLTPCVLPMLPIFSTMLVGSCKNKIEIKDDVELEADKATAHLNATQDESTESNNNSSSDRGDRSTDGHNLASDEPENTQNNAANLTDSAHLENLSHGKSITPSAKQGFFSRFDGDFKTIVIQNLGYTIGLSFTYMILGLLFSSLGASLHSILQSSTVLIAIAVLLCICALSCAGVIELKVPNFITIKLQDKISNLNTGKFSGAMLFGVLSALIASPCTSAPLAGALLYVFATGNQLLGALYFLAIGLGMAFPLFLIGVFGSKFLSRSRVLGNLVKRLLVVVLLITAYILVCHLLGNFDLIVRTLLIYIVCVYVLVSIISLILKHNLQMSRVLLIALFSLVPSYMAFTYFEQNNFLNKYEFFTRVDSVYDLQLQIKNKYSFVVFTADWCTNCEQMEQDVYSNDRFTLAANDLNKLLVDISDTKSEKTKEFIKEYNLVGVPCYILLDPAGNIVEKRLGVQSRTSVINSIHQLKYKSKYNL